jgi:hypothetical protein
VSAATRSAPTVDLSQPPSSCAEDARATTAGDVDWWRATAAVSRRLRHTHRSRAAAIAALRASEAVLGAPGAAELPHDAVVHAARAAGDLARVLVASGPPFALNVSTSGWEDLIGATSPPPPPTAAPPTAAPPTAA